MDRGAVVCPHPGDARGQGDSGAAVSSVPRRQEGSVEQQHGAGDLTGFHGPESLVDVAQTAALADHLVEFEAALAVELQVVRNVGAELVRSHAGGLNFAL